MNTSYTLSYLPVELIERISGHLADPRDYYNLSISSQSLYRNLWTNKAARKRWIIQLFEGDWDCILWYISRRLERDHSSFKSFNHNIEYNLALGALESLLNISVSNSSINSIVTCYQYQNQDCIGIERSLSEALEFDIDSFGEELSDSNTNFDGLSRFNHVQSEEFNDAQSDQTAHDDDSSLFSGNSGSTKFNEQADIIDLITSDVSQTFLENSTCVLAPDCEHSCSNSNQLRQKQESSSSTPFVGCWHKNVPQQTLAYLISKRKIPFNAKQHLLSAILECHLVPELRKQGMISFCWRAGIDHGDFDLINWLLKNELVDTGLDYSSNDLGEYRGIRHKITLPSLEQLTSSVFNQNHEILATLLDIRWRLLAKKMQENSSDLDWTWLQLLLDLVVRRDDTIALRVVIDSLNGSISKNMVIEYVMARMTITSNQRSRNLTRESFQRIGDYVSELAS